MPIPSKDIKPKVGHPATRSKKPSVSSKGFVDNRAESQAIVRTQELAQMSSQVSQLGAVQQQIHRAQQSATSARQDSAIVQMVIANPIKFKPLKSLADQNKATSSQHLREFAESLEVLSERIGKNNSSVATATLREKKGRLLDLVKKTKEANDEVEVLMPMFSSTDRQSNVDKAAYKKIVDIEGHLEQFGAAVNNEIATLVGITRKGPGNRPDANDETAIDSLVDETTTNASNLLGLDTGEKQSIGAFKENQGETWKEKREALSAIWAKRDGAFTNLTPGKGNKYGADVEYKTTDGGKPELWDQKTLYYGHTGFDGRIHHTHTKNKDDSGKGVGLLFDSTFIRPKNYEKAWLHIHEAVLSGEIAPEAIKETKAADPSKLRAGIFVDMTESYGSGGAEKDIKWLENQLASKGHPYATIGKSKVNGRNLSGILTGTVQPYNKYSNNRGWLPRGVWYEYPATGFFNNGRCRYVMNEAKTEIYLTVTHYKGYTVKPAPPHDTEVSRNPFIKVV